MKKIILTGNIWKYQGPAAWYFLSSKKEQKEVIQKHWKGGKGWRSIPVRITIGESTFTTSLFPVKDGTYLLPIKASVRKSEGLYEGTHTVAQCVFT